MRTKVAFAAAVLALCGAGSAHAQISFTVSPSPDPAVTPGFDTAFQADIVNNGPTDIIIDGSSLTSSVTGLDNEQDFVFSDLPLTLTANGGSFHTADLFELNIAGNQYSYLYQIDSNNAVVGTASFSNITGVPEPGSLALLVGGMTTGGLFLARRRRK